MNRTEKKIALNKQINDFTEDLKSKAGGFKNLGKDALVIGGIIVAGYSLMKLFTDDEDESEEVSSEVESPSIFTSAIKGAASTILLAVAKSKLTDYLESLNQDDSEQDS
ncbi:hypothetical protein [Arcticibacterium luteifluviistationis]|uniref:DUF4235 domain-containing protein n=1 Tax=Arcticibacterium luteifluviistationis TaxID=1784714 RepID=A0A2Z4GBX5_9BACT|nr:hypothetical protein [Arcticibacterium luteifluviistationis]AWV98651.1 hypothetical protein DJ013_10910 [Arcticibacterium luteifluviistationis]